MWLQSSKYNYRVYERHRACPRDQKQPLRDSSGSLSKKLTEIWSKNCKKTLICMKMKGQMLVALRAFQATLISTTLSFPRVSMPALLPPHHDFRECLIEGQTKPVSLHPMQNLFSTAQNGGQVPHLLSSHPIWIYSRAVNGAWQACAVAATSKKSSSSQK